MTGDPVPLVAYTPPSTVTVPPPRSDRMAADELPLVKTRRFLAFIVPPPVVIRPPEQLPRVSMTESEMLTVVPSP